MGKILGADGKPAEERDLEIPFQWAALDTTHKDVLLQSLSDGIQAQIVEAIKERIRTSFDTDRFRKMSDKDVFMIQMVLRVPVSLILRILKEFDDGVRKAEEQVPEVTEGGGGNSQDPDAKADDGGTQAQQENVHPLRDLGHDGAERSE